MSWDRERALRLGRARTRNGRDVFILREAILNVRSKETETESINILIGAVVLDKRPYRKNTILKTELHYWEGGGLGHHGGDDLVDYPDQEISKREVRRRKIYEEYQKRLNS